MVIPFNNKVKNTNFQAKHDNDGWNQDLELEDKSIKKEKEKEVIMNLLISIHLILSINNLLTKIKIQKIIVF